MVKNNSINDLNLKSISIAQSMFTAYFRNTSPIYTHFRWHFSTHMRLLNRNNNLRVQTTRENVRKATSEARTNKPNKHKILRTPTITHVAPVNGFHKLFWLESTNQKNLTTAITVLELFTIDAIYHITEMWLI